MTHDEKQPDVGTDAGTHANNESAGESKEDNRAGDTAEHIQFKSWNVLKLWWELTKHILHRRGTDKIYVRVDIPWGDATPVTGVVHDFDWGDDSAPYCMVWAELDVSPRAVQPSITTSLQKLKKKGFQIFCATCQAEEGEHHESWCHRKDWKDKSVMGEMDG